MTHVISPFRKSNVSRNFVNHGIVVPRRFSDRVYGGKHFVNVYENDNSIFTPQLWAMESIAILTENMVTANLVYRNFEPTIQKYGDTINIPKPGKFTAKRKGKHDNVVVQDAISENVQVKLDQWIHVSFMIDDGEESTAFKDLVEEYLRPALIAEARFLDMILLGQYVHFLPNSVGGFGSLTGDNSLAKILSLRQKLNEMNVPNDGQRHAILAPSAETTLLSNELFLAADKLGDNGTALREASLGKKLGLNFWMDQNAPTVAGGSTTNNGLVNNVGGYTAGTTVLTVDGFVGIVATGTWITIEGEMAPHRVAAHTETTGNTTEITLLEPLVADVADDAVITTYTPGAVDNTGGYAAGYEKEITVDGFTVAPRVGQAVSFGTSPSTAALYSIVEVNGLVGIVLDRPLEAAIADDAAVNIGPAGSYSMVFHRNAIALVTRPLATPRAGTGALSAVVPYNGFAVRVTITYQGMGQGHLVTIDMLAGVKVLDEDLGTVLLS